MAKPTLRGQLLAGLLALGEHVVPHTSRRYVVTSAHLVGDGQYFFIGRSGALRYGRTATGSFVASDQLRRRILTAVAAPAPAIEEDKNV